MQMQLVVVLFMVELILCVRILKIKTDLDQVGLTLYLKIMQNLAMELLLQEEIKEIIL